jgi:transketolase
MTTVLRDNTRVFYLPIEYQLREGMHLMAVTVAEQEEVKRIAKGIRSRVLAHTIAQNGGYMSQACSAAEILGSLYSGLVDLKPLAKPLLPAAFSGTPKTGPQVEITGAEYHGVKSAQSDRLISSPAHYALVIYAALIEAGRLAEHALDDFNKDGSTVEMIGAEHSPGFETTTGSLAQAISQAGGIALARKIKGETGKTWVFMSDGEFQEGQTWEALSATSFHKLQNVKVIVDVNQAQCDGPMSTVMNIEPLADRITAFGWDVSVVDGHNIEEIFAAGRAETDKPKMILCYTDPVRGLPILAERAPLFHYLRFTSPEERARYQVALEEMTK